MAREKRGRMTVRLSSELATALELSAERVGLPIATQAMLLLRQALSRTMESKEYAERLDAARRGRTKDEYLHDMSVAAEELAGGQERGKGSVQQGTAAQDAGPVPSSTAWGRVGQTSGA